MRKLLVLGMCLVGLAFVGTAQGQTTITEPVGSHFPYQRWIDESLVPTPDVTIEVIEETEGDCPIPGVPEEAAACTRMSEDKIWIDPGQTQGFHPRFVFMHEIGHNFDADVMPEWARARFDQIYGLTETWWGSAYRPNTPAEDFADTYAECSLKPYLTRRIWDAEGLAPLYGSDPLFGWRVAYNKACRMIQAL